MLVDEESWESEKNEHKEETQSRNAIYGAGNRPWKREWNREAWTAGRRKPGENTGLGIRDRARTSQLQWEWDSVLSLRPQGHSWDAQRVRWRGSRPGMPRRGAEREASEWHGPLLGQPWSVGTWPRGGITPPANYVSVGSKHSHHCPKQFQAQCHL